MILGSKQKVKKSTPLPLYINNVAIDYVTSYKYLGITVDQTLSFNLYLNQVIKTVSYKISLLIKIRKYITSKSAIQVYKSMSIPYLDYGDILFNHGPSKLLDKLQKLQNRSLKVCFDPQRNMTIENMHTEANVMFLHNRRK